MKNIQVSENDNLEEILENETLPISVNHELVIMSYEEYMKCLEIIHPKKAKEIKEKVDSYKRKEED